MHRIRSLALAIALAAIALAATAAHAQSAPTTRAQRRAILLAPTNKFWLTHAPDTLQIDLETSRGTITIEVPRAWAPRGADRFYNLVRAGYFDDSRFYRVVQYYIAQFGIAGDPAIAQLWNAQKLRADPRKTENVRGTITYAQFNKNDRSTNLFINLNDSPSLDSLGFVPIGRVVAGLEVADSLYSGYGNMPTADPPLGDGRRLYGEGNKYMDRKYPKLDRLIKATVRDSLIR